MTTMTEARVLRALKDEAKRCDLLVIRQALMPGVTVGWPDTIVVGNGLVLFAELKRPGKPLTPIQEERARQIQKRCHHYAKIDSVEEARATVLRFGAMCAGLKVV